MTAAALSLALALLVGAGPLAARQRAGVVAPGCPTREKNAAADPLAVASALDVLAVCLEAGMGVAHAAAATAPSAPAPLGRVLQRAADLLALGADPETAWTADDSDDLEVLARLARRSASSGSALAQGVRELAEQLRQDAVHTAEAAAERAGVLIAGPLGLCFLPAFVCLGVVPVIVGLAGQIDFGIAQ
jgi:pilus assembly protein TadC